MIIYLTNAYLENRTLFKTKNKSGLHQLGFYQRNRKKYSSMYVYICIFYVYV